MKDQWNPSRETPQRHTLWHTPRRLKRNEKADPAEVVVLYNPDTRSTHSLLGGIRIFGRIPGHKSRERDPFMRGRDPARINDAIEPSGRHVTISTDGSAMNNGWENAVAGIGVWYADESEHNIKLKLVNNGKRLVSNSRAELGAILEALRQNERDDLEIESDSLTSLRAICTLSERYEDLNWAGTRNEDLLKGIMIRLRTRPAQTSFKWVKGHGDDYGNIRADALADEGRESDSQVEVDEEEWIRDHPALQDGARLQALDARHIYKAVLGWHTRKVIPILHQEKLEDAKDKIQGATGLRPTNEKLLRGPRSLGVPPRLKDHIRNMLTGRLKCGSYWGNIPGYTERAYCSFCKTTESIEILESEQHIWLECEHNGQARVWETTKGAWEKTTDRAWPAMTMGLIRGAAALTFGNDHSRDSERLRILISMAVWAIWKSRNEKSINDQVVAACSAKEVLKGLIRDLVRKSWNATRFMEGSRRMDRQTTLRALWADKRFADFDAVTGPTVDFS